MGSYPDPERHALQATSPRPHGKNFELEQAIKALQSGQELTGKNGVQTPLIKQITETALKAELGQHLEDGCSAKS